MSTTSGHYRLSILSLSLGIASSLAARLPVRDGFSSCLTGDGLDVLTASSPNWDTAITPFNLRLEGDFIPSAMVYPTSAAEVSAAVTCASQYGLKVSPISGGHSYSASGFGEANGTLVISTANLTSVSVDNTTGLAYVQPGIRLGQMALDIYNQAGRALAHGTCPQVGAGGHTSFGGYGFGSRKWGLMLDQVVQAEAVLANGTIVNASATENSDLFWALRGAAPSFAIVTQWTYQTHEAPANVVGFTYEYDTTSADEFSDVLTAYTNWAVSSAPEEIGLEANIRNLTISVTGMYEGSESDYNTVIAPLLAAMGTPTNTTVNNYGWIEALDWVGGVDSIATDGVPDTHDTFFVKSLITPLSSPLTADTYTTWGQYLLDTQNLSSSLAWFMQVELYGGANSAINSPATDATPFPFRDSLFTIQLYASSANSEPPYPYADGYSFLEGVVDLIENSLPGADFGAYANYIDATLEDWQDKYYKGNYDRLLALQAEYDPQDTYLKHQNVGSE